METKKIEIIVEERTTKREGKEKKFNTYKTFSKNGRKMDVKFRAEVNPLPTSHCYAVINVDEMNIDNSGRFPVLWVKSVEEYISIEDARKENNKAKLDEFFD